MKKLVAFLLLFTAFGCSEDEGTPIWRIWYAVQVIPNFDLDIEYYSDKYHDTGVLETFNVHDSSYVQELDGFWVGQHLQNDRETGYYININVKGINAYNGNLNVLVYANDTNLIDSTSFPFGTSSVTLQGAIPKNF